MIQTYKEIKLTEISSNPQNPRKSFEGPSFDELVESIREKGVIEPIIIRQLYSGKTFFEVVAGERRFRAACLIAGKELSSHKIPAVIRELSDDEAFDFMIIENLQREDLTPFEEAQSFREYFIKKGKGSVSELAKRIGKSAGYIRRKIAALSLPGYVLKAWQKGELQFSHLEQLRRLKNPKELREAFDFVMPGPWRDEIKSKRELKEHIDENSPSLKKAAFDLEKVGCNKCDQNSDVQQGLWEIRELKDAHCLNKICFQRNQINFLTKNWKKSKYSKRFGTNGFRISDTLNYNQYEAFEKRWGTQPVDKCKECESYITILHSSGEIKDEKACLKPGCYRALGREVSKSEKEESGSPRVEWHGEYFREEFFKKRIRAVYKKFEPADIKVSRLTLFSFVNLQWGLCSWLAKQLGIKDDHRIYDDDSIIFKKIETLNLEQIQELMQKLAIKVLMDASKVNAKGRRAAAEHFGIDLAKEWVVNEDYLEKKTIKEMLKFGEASKIFKDKKAKDYLIKTLKKKPGKYSSCKKTELIELFLKSGADLVGKVPKEILAKN